VTVALPPKRVWRTGRSMQINIKATAEAVNRYYALAEQLNVPLGALLERMLDTLEASLSDGEKK